MISFKKILNSKKEYKTLGEIATEIYRGNGVNKDQIGSGNYPYVHYGELFRTYEIWFDKCISSVNPDLIKKKKYCETGDLLVTSDSNTKEGIGAACAYIGIEPAIFGDHIFLIKHNQNPKYLSYALSTRKAYLQKRKLSNRGTITHISVTELKKLQLPIPTLEIQEQIVAFLDLLRSEVKRVRRELEERQKQYEYYKDLIIGRIEKKVKLEEISEIFRGNNITKNDVSETGFPCILYRDVNLNEDLFIDQAKHFVDINLIKKPRFCCEGDILTTSSNYINGKSYLGKPCAYIGEKKVIPGSDVLLIKHKQNPKYLAYTLSIRDVQIQNKTLGRLINWGIKIKPEEAKKIIIPLPDLSTQESIANTIDKFRKLCVEILPRELDLVQKRYEYYKNSLIDGL